MPKKWNSWTLILLLGSTRMAAGGEVLDEISMNHEGLCEIDLLNLITHIRLAGKGCFGRHRSVWIGYAKKLALRVDACVRC